MKNRELPPRIWAGDASAVAEVRRAYQADPAGQLLPMAAALYSFRNRRAFAEELAAMRPALLERAEGARRYDGVTPPFSPEEADMLATYLEWLSRRAKLAEERRPLRGAAKSVCALGIDLALHRPSGPRHTLPLLRLTAARIELDAGLKDSAREKLDDVARGASGIEDPNQRARVWRKLGLLYRWSGAPVLGVAWGIGACVVGGIPLGARAKSLAALVGYDV